MKNLRFSPSRIKSAIAPDSHNLPCSLEWGAPFILLLVCLLGFGLSIWQTGFFWDDWIQTLSHHYYGIWDYWRYFSDRPYSAWTHFLFIPLLGDQPRNWQIFTLALRWLTALAVWRTCLCLWQEKRLQALMVGTVFAVYPSFTQQSIALAYHQHWLQYLLVMGSLAFMLQALRQQRHSRLYTALAVALQFLSFTISEFFISLELLRPLLLWCTTERKAGIRWRLKETARRWLPFLTPIAAYIVWRLSFRLIYGMDPNPPEFLKNLSLATVATLQKLVSGMTTDTLTILITSWSKVFDLRLSEMRQPLIWLSWLVSAGLAVFLSAFLMLKFRRFAGLENAHSDRFTSQALLIGGVGALLGPAPLWLTGENMLSLVDFYHADRFTLSAMFPASLFFVALLDWLATRPPQKIAAFSLLIGLLVGYHLRIANDYRWLSIQQTRFYWQFSWRVPSLERGTALLVEDILFPFQGHFATSAALNLLYPPPEPRQPIPYWFYALRPKLESKAPLGVSLHSRTRTFEFFGKTGESLLLVYGAPSANCLWVLSPQDADNPDLSPLMKKWTVASNLERIHPEPAAPGYPPITIFGEEPSHSWWCYFYQKAELARQQRDWQTVAALGDEAQIVGYNPQSDGSNATHEWLPFIEAYAHLNRWEDALRLTLQNFERDGKYAPQLCNRWRQLQQDTPESSAKRAALQTVFEQLKCVTN